MLVSGSQFFFWGAGVVAGIATRTSAGEIDRRLQACRESVVPFALGGILFVLCMRGVAPTRRTED